MPKPTEKDIKITDETKSSGEVTPPKDEIPASTPEAPLYKGKKEVKTQEELLAYVAELEGQIPPTEPTKPPATSEDSILAPEKNSGSTSSAAKIDLDLSDDEQVLASLLTNPKETVDKLAEKVLEKVKEESQTEYKAKEAWKNFYTANKDLEPFGDLVDLMTQSLKRKWEAEGRQVSWVEGSTILAQEARKIVKRIRGSDSEIEEVDTGKNPAMVSSSGNPAPRVGKEPGEKKSFSDQVRSWQQKKVRTAV